MTDVLPLEAALYEAKLASEEAIKRFSQAHFGIHHLLRDIVDFAIHFPFEYPPLNERVLLISSSHNLNFAPKAFEHDNALFNIQVAKRVSDFEYDEESGQGFCYFDIGNEEPVLIDCCKTACFWLSQPAELHKTDRVHSLINGEGWTNWSEPVYRYLHFAPEAAASSRDELALGSSPTLLLPGSEHNLYLPEFGGVNGGPGQEVSL